jgi:hypothetical protein
VWVSGTVKAGKWHDIMVYMFNLKGLLHPGEMVEAHIGYRGDPAVRDPDTVFSRVDKHAHEMAQARNETINGRLKIFRVLSSMF